MRVPFPEFLSSLSEAFVIAAREATQKSHELAERADELAIDVPIGGVPLHVEGAANLPKRILMLRRTSFDTSAFIEIDKKGELQVTLKRSLFKRASKINIEMEFVRSKPLEPMELVRDRAIEVVKDNIQLHRQQVPTNNIIIQEDTTNA